MTSGSETPNFAAPRIQVSAFKRYVGTIVEHAWLVVLCVVVCVAGTAVYVATAPRKYQATADMLISPIPADTTTLVGLPVLFSSGNQTTDVLTASSLITTPQVAANVVRTLGLNESPGALLANVTATPVGASNLVSVTATASSAAEAQRIANAFPAAVIATREAALHNAIAAILPSLQAQAAKLPRALRGQPGTVHRPTRSARDACDSPRSDDDARRSRRASPRARIRLG